MAGDFDLLLSIFPSRDVFREGHIGIPFSHWFQKESRVRFYYTWALRGLGLGTWKDQAPTARQWAVDKLGCLREAVDKLKTSLGLRCLYSLGPAGRYNCGPREREGRKAFPAFRIRLP